MAETLTENDVKNLIVSRAAVDKLVAAAKAENAAAKEYKDLVTSVGLVSSKTKAFLAAGPQAHAGKTPRNDAVYLAARKEITELVNIAKKAVNAIKAGKSKAAADLLREAHVNALIQGKANLDKLVEEAKKEDEKSKHYVTLTKQVAAAGNVDTKIAACKANIGKVPKTFKDFVATNANLMKLIPLAKLAIANIKADKVKPWTVTCHAAVTSAAKSKSCAALGRVMSDIKKLGVAAGGLRHIKGNVYDVHCSTSGDDRWVGVADAPNKKFAFKGHYDHGKKGKVFKAGEKVSGY